MTLGIPPPLLFIELVMNLQDVLVEENKQSLKLFFGSDELGNHSFS